MVEKHIIQARAQATAEEERTLNMLKADAGEDFQYLDLPPGEVSEGDMYTSAHLWDPEHSQRSCKSLGRIPLTLGALDYALYECKSLIFLIEREKL